MIALPLVVAASVAFGQCPAPPPSISSSQLPVDVAQDPGNCNPITLFDDFSWKSFVALVWPAAQGQRGVPDSSNTSFPNSVPLVFETYKADWESFPDANSAPPGSPVPTQWSAFAGAQNPCAAQAPNIGWGDMVLASDTKFGNLGLAGFGPFLVGPLITQPGPGLKPSYVRYQAVFNKTEYDPIFNNKLYLQSNIPTSGVTFCSNGATVGGNACPQQNSVDVKSSWVDMSSVPQNLWSRYYTRQAWVFDPAVPNQGCSNLTIGLVGLHIVSKTPSRSAWIWSSFEQVDNVPVPGAQPPFSRSYYNFHDQTNTPMPAVDPYCIGSAKNACPPNPNPNNVQPMPPVAPAPFNVTRLVPIAQSTQNTNAQYQKLLQNTPWQNYQLVMTQWPLNAANAPNPPDPNAHCGQASVTFQGVAAPGVRSPPPLCFSSTNPNQFFGSCDPTQANGGPNCTASANVTMETFDQAKIGTGCMSCHNATGQATDFLWALPVNAYPPPSPPTGQVAAAPLGAAASAREKSLNDLRELLQSTVPANEAAISAARSAAPPK